MSRTYTEIRDLIEQILQDTGNSVWGTSELDVHIPEGIMQVSRYVPHHAKLTLSATASSQDITLTSGDKHRLLWIEKAEYQVDQSPRKFRNVSRWGDVITLDMTLSPSSGDDVYLYVAQLHRLQLEIGTDDTAGAVNTAGTAGDTTLALKSLGTGTINKYTKLEIAGDSTDYEVITDATIDTNAATVSIYPALQAAAAEDAVVTLSLNDSTLDDILEGLLAEYVAGKAAISKARYYVNKINIGSAMTNRELEQWGTNKLALAISELKRIAPARVSQLYSRS